MRVSDIMIKMLAEKDVKFIFGISAGTVVHFLISNNYNIKVITQKMKQGQLILQQNMQLFQIN